MICLRSTRNDTEPAKRARHARDAGGMPAKLTDTKQLTWSCVTWFLVVLFVNQLA